MTFKPRRAKPLIVLFCGAVFVVAGLAVWYVVGVHLFSLCFTFPGLVAVLSSGADLRLRTVVDDSGIARERWWTRTRVPWDTIEWWTTADAEFDEDGDSVTFRVARFHVYGAKRPIEVYDCEVSRPGYDAFLQAVRQFRQAQEVSRTATESEAG